MHSLCCFSPGNLVKLAARHALAWRTLPDLMPWTMADLKLTFLGGFEVRLASGEVADLPAQKDRAIAGDSGNDARPRSFPRSPRRFVMERARRPSGARQPEADPHAATPMPQSDRRRRAPRRPPISRAQPGYDQRGHVDLRTTCPRGHDRIAQTGNGAISRGPARRDFNPRSGVRGLAAGRTSTAAPAVRAGARELDGQGAGCRRSGWRGRGGSETTDVGSAQRSGVPHPHAGPQRSGPVGAGAQALRGPS